ncbi:rab-protein geranylgeranyltransferase [Sistotremastrum niveocremeum HHB9708]|uniref:Geranylgeranyl transferase type-2 subunit alpha n=1 Tax=Sistotremastrum niveocremeum HHB9708 TaxID=1314777 RepID=A0A165AKS1_9AGAM|nr:rab-protein geranylgeranyltransferase [Sistotremastrum niveocremeum HHB9708]
MVSNHNVKRTRVSPEALEAKRLKELSKVKEYLALNDDLLARKRSKTYRKEDFEATTRILSINPEFYTAWNYRREIFLNGLFPASTPAQIDEFLSSDLDMTMAQLQRHPKVYWIWNHRRWCLEHVPEGPGEDGDSREGWRRDNWNKEMFVAEKMLDRDPRNFHAWNYRRYIVASWPSIRTKDDELKYTKKKIQSNFSNFSAWHQRSKVLGAMWEVTPATRTEQDEGMSSHHTYSRFWLIILEEFEFVKSALWTDPGDQSAWIYHRWLIGEGDDLVVLQREIDVIEELLVEEPDSKWCLDSLVHFQRLLLQHKDESSVDVSSIQQRCAFALTKLEAIDPKRNQRYQDIKLQL